MPSAPAAETVKEEENPVAEEGQKAAWNDGDVAACHTDGQQPTGSGRSPSTSALLERSVDDELKRYMKFLVIQDITVANGISSVLES